MKKLDLLRMPGWLPRARTGGRGLSRTCAFVAALGAYPCARLDLRSSASDAGGTSADVDVPRFGVETPFVTDWNHPTPFVTDWNHGDAAQQMTMASDAASVSAALEDAGRLTLLEAGPQDAGSLPSVPEGGTAILPGADAAASARINESFLATFPRRQSFHRDPLRCVPR